MASGAPSAAVRHAGTVVVAPFSVEEKVVEEDIAVVVAAVAVEQEAGPAVVR